MSKRDAKILELLTVEKKMDVTRLSERLGVSNVTMRKDLDSLQDRGLVLREHGFALLANPNDVSGRLAYHYEEKRRIAQRAAELVPDGSTIMIESGSCCAILARELAVQKQGVTVVTNSVFIANYLRDFPSVEAILLGGIMQRDSQVTVGPLLRTCAREFAVDHLFVGADGWIDGVGFTNGDQMRAEADRTMAESAGHVVVLTESEKFRQHGAIPLRFGDKPLGVVTDPGLGYETLRRLEQMGIETLIA
ncbi:hypothetical protein HMPREF1008_00703 [Olsenella sp. oral taxon 809 str. F0356]|uniref:DeoR/GlpR family DNA-binding transcription regulator n=1 Tax=Olsenella sp. oral taxon 809 TaxID=661086 RepID=UPI000231F315|nr:DeoR/GlpR family DNA-binding transcription regulator [Olsenella sp. oral taxon 809]EHF02298.1 hypothetical protein HMPREF1008_00703 [Olsenella sp. oral taxon 809 str. F0356]